MGAKNKHSGADDSVGAAFSLQRTGGIGIIAGKTDMPRLEEEKT